MTLKLTGDNRYRRAELLLDHDWMSETARSIAEFDELRSDRSGR